MNSTEERNQKLVLAYSRANDRNVALNSELAEWKNRAELAEAQHKRIFQAMIQVRNTSAVASHYVLNRITANRQEAEQEPPAPVKEENPFDPSYDPEGWGPWQNCEIIFDSEENAEKIRFRNAGGKQCVSAHRLSS